MIALFKAESELSVEDYEMWHPGLREDILDVVHDELNQMPQTIHKTVLKSIVIALLQDRDIAALSSLMPVLFFLRIALADEVRIFFILIQNPVFAAQSSYTVFAYLLKQIVNLSSTHRQLLIQWFRGVFLRKKNAKNAAIDLSKPSPCFPISKKSTDSTLPPPPVHYTDLYNSALDHLDLMNEFFVWQNGSQNPQREFSYCQYPFLLSIVAKRSILTKDSEQQMIQTARRSIEAKGPFYRYRYRYQPQMDIFFLNIKIRRSHLVSDSLNEIAAKQQDLKKKLKVSFIGEPGLDMGGLAKEWLLLLIRHIFEPDYGISRAGSYESHIVSQNKNLREFNLIGVIMGLAVYNSITLDLHFPSICYRKLLSPPIAPWSFISEPELEDDTGNFDYETDGDSSDDDSIDYNEIGFVEAAGIEALAEIMPDVARGLSELLAYEGNVEEDMCMNFQVSLEEYGEMRTYDIKEGGADIPVTNENRHEYVALYLDWVLNSAIYHQFRAFYLGFHSVCDSNALLLLRPEEVEMLVCGSPTIDLHELKKVTEYDGYHEDDPLIRDFWEVLGSLSLDLQKKFLHFTTGSDRVPVGGMSEMTFKITKLPSISSRSFNRMRRRNGETRNSRQNEVWDSNDQEEQLPEAHTCFNQLVLPPYRSQETLRQKLIIAISNSEGFGLE
ncbi:hypothetical protein J437_LFUL001360 [Ladona fulva]|uniref:HECT-type E3 ubiquitin transferase n=1 Tax=Ladona fulva TaxID=123851 RepID=A0A8K0NV66_LADFU|nr:hypothetical protein J437_LFUL001360 [Ladona fulva]